MRIVVLLAALALAACSPATKTPEATPPAKSAPPKILMFYPNQAVATTGEKVLICYGVEDAVSVSIDPPVEELKPSLNRCFEAPAQKSSKYTLKATGKDGTSVEQSFDVKVEAGAARAPAQKAAGGGKLIHFFSGNQQQVRPGEQAMLCYDVAPTAELSMTPDPKLPLARPKGCVQVSPQADTTYTLTAKGANGESEHGEVRLRVAR